MSIRKSEHRASKSEQRARKAEWRMIREFLKNGTRRFRVLRSAETTFGKYGRVGGRCLPAPTFQERHGHILPGVTAASSIQPMPNPYQKDWGVERHPEVDAQLQVDMDACTRSERVQAEGDAVRALIREVDAMLGPNGHFVLAIAVRNVLKRHLPTSPQKGDA